MKTVAMQKLTDEICNTKDYENLNELLGKDLGGKIYKLIHLVKTDVNLPPSPDLQKGSDFHRKAIEKITADERLDMVNKLSKISMNNLQQKYDAMKKDLENRLYNCSKDNAKIISKTNDLQQKYDELKQSLSACQRFRVEDSASALSEINTWKAKYDKLKEVFEELLGDYNDYTYQDRANKIGTKYWKQKAGI